MALSNTASLLLCLSASAGCNAIMGSLMAQVPHVDGRWRGRVIEVAVFDDRARASTAAALEVTAGPDPADMRPRHASATRVSDAHSGATPPLLVRCGGDGCRVIDPAELPVGRTV